MTVMLRSLGSKASLEHRGVTIDPDVAHHRVNHNVRVVESDMDSEEEFQDSREELPSVSLAGPIAVLKSATTPIPT